VLLPLACIGTIAIAVRRSWRQRFGVLVVLAAAAATALLPVATSSGEALERHVGDPGQHAALGDQLIWFTVPLLVLAAALVWADHRSWSLPRLRTIGALAVVAALAASVQVYRVGDSGARAAWGARVSAPAFGEGPTR
jgi:predicted membrane protein DUF2231